MGLHKILKIAALALSVIGIIFFVMLLSKGDDAIVDSGGEGLDGYLYTSYIMLGLVVAFVLGFVLKGLFTSGDLKKTLMSVGVFGVIIIISYVMSSGSIEGLPVIDGKEISESGSKWVGTGLHVFYILALVAIGLMAFGGIKKISK